VLYNVVRRDGSAQSLALRVRPDGAVEEVEPPPPARLPRTRWRVERPTRADAGHAPRLVRTLQDAPFYARSVVATHLLGEPAVAVHESLDLDRFRTPWVQAMLPFRIPRVLG
jgi:carotenoid 1,2-hydratase